MAGAGLCIDFGTSNTAAVLHRGGRPVPLLFDGSPLLPSAVYLADNAELLVGTDAERSARVTPEGLEPNPKRRIDDGTVWLGDRELPVVELIAAVLRRVIGEAERVAAHAIADAVLTHPAELGGPRLSVLGEAARRAGLSETRLVAEPVAAATYFAAVLESPVPPGKSVVVYDLGAGTFDVAVVKRTGDGFVLLASSGLADIGGLDLDAAIVGHVRSLTGDAASAWVRLDWPESSADQRARRLLWQDARAAKEQLSRHSTAALHVPLVEADLHVTRDEFEKLAGPLLADTVARTLATVRAAGIGPESVAALFLVGGSSRVPLAASMLHRALKIAPTVIEQPELAVATGAGAASASIRVRPSPRPDDRTGPAPWPQRRATSAATVPPATVRPAPLTESDHALRAGWAQLDALERGGDATRRPRPAGPRTRVNPDIDLQARWARLDALEDEGDPDRGSGTEDKARGRWRRSPRKDT